MGNVFGGCEVILKARHTPASVCLECRAPQRCTDAVRGAEKTGSSKRNKVSIPRRRHPGERDTLETPGMSPCNMTECSSEPWSKRSRGGGWRVARPLKSDCSLRRGEAVRSYMHHSYSGLVSLDISQAKCKSLEMKQQLNSPSGTLKPGLLRIICHRRKLFCALLNIYQQPWPQPTRCQ